MDHSQESHHLSKISDPIIIGPGTWSIIHKFAIKIKNKKECYQYIEMITKIIENFSCGDCSKHGMEYIKKYPLENYINISSKYGKWIGMFEWSHKFHNKVNSILNKPLMSFEDAWILHNEHSSCYLHCNNIDNLNINNDNNDNINNKQVRFLENNYIPYSPAINNFSINENENEIVVKGNSSHIPINYNRTDDHEKLSNNLRIRFTNKK